MSFIEISRLEVYAYHGCFQEENRLGQKFYISAKLEVDTERVGMTDDLKMAVNYGEICRAIHDYSQNTQLHLIETLAERLAVMILERFKKVRSVEILVDKPNCPVPYHFESIQVRIKKSRHIAYIGLGSNVGDRKQTLTHAVAALDRHEQIIVSRISKLYETKPYGVTDQPDFLNGCIEVETYYSPETLLGILNSIEQQFGRKRDVHWGPRTLDMDILLYDQAIIDRQDLHIPHIDMHNRMFVLAPLSEIAGFYRHPVLGRTVSDLLSDLEERAGSRDDVQIYDDKQ